MKSKKILIGVAVTLAVVLVAFYFIIPNVAPLYWIAMCYRLYEEPSEITVIDNKEMFVDVAMGEKLLAIYPGPKRIRMKHKDETILLVKDLSSNETIFEKKNF